MKDSFILFTEHKEIVDQLSNEQAGKLFKAIYEWVINEQLLELDPITKIAFIPIKQSIDRNNDKWLKIKEKRSEAGKKGMESRWGNITNVKDVITNDNKEYQSLTNITDSVSVSDSVHVSVSDSVSVSAINNSVNSKEEEKIEELKRQRKERKAKGVQ